VTGYLVIPVVVLAASALFWVGAWVDRRGGARLSRNTAVDHHLLYQPLTACVAGAAVVAAMLLSDDPWAYLRLGDPSTPVTGLGWLGVGTGDTWLAIGISIGLIITGVTALVVVLQARRSGPLRARALPLALALSLPFAAVNAAVEEAIFRLAPATALGGVASMTTVALLSAVMFGAPHYFGHPGKVPGVLLAGFLGWLACLSVLQTHGMLWAWSVHFAQDVVILTVLFAVAAAGAGTAGREAPPDPADGQAPVTPSPAAPRP
jgi:uncharacterized protein